MSKVFRSKCRSRRSRLAVIPALMAALIPSVLLLTKVNHLGTDVEKGLITGVLLGISLGSIILMARSRRDG